MKPTKQHQTTPNGINDDAEGCASESCCAEVAHGEWLPMLDEIGISRSCAARLMRIGEKFSNVDTGLHLPGSYKVLYELSRMDPGDIDRGIESGAMHARVSGTW